MKIPGQFSVQLNKQAIWEQFTAQQSAHTDAMEAANDHIAVKLEAIEGRLAGMAEDQRTGHAAIISTGNRAAKVLEGASRGDTLAIEVDNVVTTRAA